MAIGDKQDAVRICVHKILNDHQIPEPIDEGKTLGGDFKFSSQIMALFHMQVQACLKPKFAYSPDETDVNFNKNTAAMTVRKLISTISNLTKPAPGLLLETVELSIPKAKKAVKKPKAKEAKAKKAGRKAAKKFKKSGKKAARRRT